MPDASVRCFMALVPPPEVRDELARVTSELMGRVRDARWVEPDKMHLTLRFFSQMPLADLPHALARLEAEALPAPFDVHLSGVGAFPNLKRARVLWVGLEGEVAKLHTLSEAVSRCFAVDHERLSPHLTLARLKRPSDLTHLARVAIARLPWTVDRLELIRSELSPTGSRYTTLWSCPLGG